MSNQVRVYMDQPNGGDVFANVEHWLQRELRDVPLENIRIFPISVQPLPNGGTLQTIGVIYDPDRKTVTPTEQRPSVRRITLRPAGSPVERAEPYVLQEAPPERDEPFS